MIKIAVSPDDKHVYAASDTTIVSFSRAADTGALTFASCLSDSGDDGRLGSEGACTDGDALNGVRDLAVSPDGKYVYAVSQYSNALVWLTRDAATGALTPAGCLKASPRGDRCGGALNLMAPSALAVSPDGRSVYVVSGFDASISVFRRDADTGALAPGRLRERHRLGRPLRQRHRAAVRRRRRRLAGRRLGVTRWPGASR